VLAAGRKTELGLGNASYSMLRMPKIQRAGQGEAHWRQLGVHETKLAAWNTFPVLLADVVSAGWG